MKISEKAKQVTKAIIAVAGAVGVAVAAAITDDTITSAEWVTIGIAFVTAVGVYWFKNDPPSGG